MEGEGAPLRSGSFSLPLTGDRSRPYAGMAVHAYTGPGHTEDIEEDEEEEGES